MNTYRGLELQRIIGSGTFALAIMVLTYRMLSLVGQSDDAEATPIADILMVIAPLLFGSGVFMTLYRSWGLRDQGDMPPVQEPLRIMLPGAYDRIMPEPLNDDIRSAAAPAA